MDSRAQKRWITNFNGTIVPAATENDRKMDESCGMAIGELQSIMHGAHFIKVDRIVRAGSYGRATLVRGHFDVDLLVFVNRYNGKKMDLGDESQLRCVRYEVMQLLKNHGHDDVEVQDGRGYSGALKLRICPTPDLPWVDVDLMLLPNMALKNTPSAARVQYDALVTDLYANPGAYEADPTREAGLSEALMKLVKGTNDQVKAVVRLVKAWYKYGLEDEGVVRHVPSVLLEVVVLAASHQRPADPRQLAIGRSPGGLPGDFVACARGGKSTFQLNLLVESLRLLEAVGKGEERVIVERQPRNQWGYSRDVALKCSQLWEGDPVKVIHPIDPTCNIAKPRPNKPSPNWESLAAEAQKLRNALLNFCELREGDSAMAIALTRLNALKRPTGPDSGDSRFTAPSRRALDYAPPSAELGTTCSHISPATWEDRSGSTPSAGSMVSTGVTVAACAALVVGLVLGVRRLAGTRRLDD